LKFADRLAAGTQWLLYADLVILIAILFAGVIARYVFNHAIFGEEDISVTLLLYLVFLGSALAIRSDDHPSISILSSRLPALREGMRGAARLVVGGYLLCIVYFGTRVALAGMSESSMTLGMPMAIPYAAVPIGSALAFIQLIAIVNRRIAVTAGSIAVFFLVWIPDQLFKMHLSSMLWVLLPVLLLAEIPIAFAIGIFAMFLIATTQDASLTVAAQQLISAVESPALLAIPTFMLTGALLETSGMAQLLIDFFLSMVGRLRGGLAIADTLASGVFADISGSAVADTAALGSVMIPSMAQQGYDEDFATAHQAASGSLGTLLPPSITAIIFSTVTNTSVVRLFRATVLPGIFLVFLFCCIAYVTARRRNYPCERVHRIREIGISFVHALPALVAPVFILGGILGGIFTPTETGAAAATYVAAASFSLYRRNLSLERFLEAARAAVTRTTIVMFIIANTFILAWALAVSGLPARTAGEVTLLSHDPRAVLLISALLIVALAVFLEPPAILTGAVPLLLPAIQHSGIDAATFGVVTLLAACIGNQIPPIGITLLVAISIRNVSLERTARQILPYTILTACTLLLAIILPSFTLVWAGR
jgi:C4-dicarboxylate transporter DctM subunit